jgi:hypothetical protein
MAPWDLVAMLGDAGAWFVYLAIGFAFGFVLESSGFGDGRKLAGQFYLTDLAVLKVMFTAIVVCMVLLFWSTALGWLDYDDVWVNPTYLWPGVLGGLIMGVGFILGGYCPGTSLVSMATLKVDGAFFVAGVATGVFLFGETVSVFADFWYSSDYGRLTLPEWLGLETGVVVFLVTCLALFMFWGATRLRRAIHGDGS